MPLKRTMNNVFKASRIYCISTTVVERVRKTWVLWLLLNMVFFFFCRKTLFNLPSTHFSGIGSSTSTRLKHDRKMSDVKY